MSTNVNIDNFTIENKSLPDYLATLNDLQFNGFQLNNNITAGKNSEYDIGSTTNKIKTLYSANAYHDNIYIDNKLALKVASDGSTVVLTNDENKNVVVEATGTGTVKVAATEEIDITTSNTSGQINMTTSTTDGTINLTANSINLDGNTIIKNLTITGTSTVVNANDLSIKDNMIEINSGETGLGVTAGTAGIKINRGMQQPYLIEYDESDGQLKAGIEGNLSVLATAANTGNYIPISGGYSITSTDAILGKSVNNGSLSLISGNTKIANAYLLLNNGTGNSSELCGQGGFILTTGGGKSLIGKNDGSLIWDNSLLNTCLHNNGDTLYDAAEYSNANNNKITLNSGASGTQNGARLDLYGTNYITSSLQGSFVLSAANNTKKISLIGDTTGNLTWNNTKILLANSSELSAKAPLNSPAFTGVPTVPTALAGTSTSQAASTQFVMAAIGTDLIKILSTGEGNAVTDISVSDSGQLQVAYETNFVNKAGDAITGNLSVAGALSSTGALSTSSSLSVGGAIIATGSISTSGNITAANITDTGALTVTGAITAKSSITATGSISTSGNIIATGTVTGSSVYNAVYNDYAELFPRAHTVDEELTEPGDIISLGDIENELYHLARKDEVIAGVQSDNFAHLIGGDMPPDGEDFVKYNLPKFIPVSLAGRVDVNLCDNCQPKVGDYVVVSDIPGKGMIGDRNDESCIGRIVKVYTNKKVKILVK